MKSLEKDASCITRICILSTSPAPISKSRSVAQAAQARLLMMSEVEVDYLDLVETPLDLYPGLPECPTRDEMVRCFNAADAWVLAGSVYNGGPSAHMLNFLHYALGADDRTGRPFVLIAGAGGGNSLFAFDALGARIRREVKGIEVGTPVVVNEDMEAAKARLSDLLDLLVPVARLNAALRSAPV